MPETLRCLFFGCFRKKLRNIGVLRHKRKDAKSMLGIPVYYYKCRYGLLF
jgi:hypothetical protein